MDCQLLYEHIWVGTSGIKKRKSRSQFAGKGFEGSAGGKENISSHCLEFKNSSKNGNWFFRT